MSNHQSPEQAFKGFEAAGWQEKTEAYDAVFAPIVAKVVGPLLDAAEVRAGC